MDLIIKSTLKELSKNDILLCEEDIYFLLNINDDIKNNIINYIKYYIDDNTTIPLKFCKNLEYNTIDTMIDIMIKINVDLITAKIYNNSNIGIYICIYNDSVFIININLENNAVIAAYEHN